MGLSRRQRGKAEGTFLEFVKESLHELRMEIIELKSLVNDLRGYGGNGALQSPYVYDSGWDSWNTWQLLDFSNDVCIEGASVGSQLQKDCNIFIPEEVAPLSREQLLAFRSAGVVGESSEDVPLCAKALAKEEGADLEGHSTVNARHSCNHIPHNPCIWQPSEQDVFQGGSSLDLESRNEAATSIQRWYRNTCAEVGSGLKANVPAFVPHASEEVVLQGSGVWESMDRPASVDTGPEIRGDFRSLPRDAWEDIYTRFSDHIEFAGSSDEEISDDYGDACIGCGGHLSPHSEFADTCDKCGPLHHSQCLHTLPHPVEPYRVCSKCASAWHGSGDFDGRALDGSVINEAVEARVVCGAADNDVSEIQRRDLEAIVESRLDYMLRYLELDSKGMVPTESRHIILQKVKKTQQWLKKYRSSQALKDKVLHLDKFMENLLRNM